MFRLRSAVASFLSIALAMLLVPSYAMAQTPTGDVVISANTTWPTAAYSLTSLTVQGGATLTIGGGSTVTTTNGVKVTAQSSILLQSINNTALINGTWQGVGVTITAASVQVDAGSSINADAQGYISSAGPGTGSGGGYGGLGGGDSPGVIYGSAASPVDLGSGGAKAQYDGSNGGGALRLVVSGTLTNNGVISANGENVEPARGGAGSGGAVYVTTVGLAGSGVFTANGGANTNTSLSGSPAGGGGRVAVYYTSASGFSGFAGSTALGGTFAGTQAGYAGSNGTTAFIDTSGTNSQLNLYGNFSLPAQSTVTFSRITIQNGATLTVGAGSTLTVTNGLSIQGASTMTIGGGSTLAVTNGIVVSDKSNILLQSMNNTALVDGAWKGVGVTIQSDSVQVDAGSTINADGQGYLSSLGPGHDDSGDGGSYGGLGGNPADTAVIYGSATMPVDLGSGGAKAQYAGSSGGGAIRLIVTGTLTNNGVISANGEMVEPNRGGAGSGGSVYVTTGALAGSGVFTATGGSNPNLTLSGSPAGGGGRIAVYYTSATAFTGFTGSTASGGTYPAGGQTGYAGSVGTAAFFDISGNNPRLNVYQNFTIPALTSAVFGQIALQNGSLLTVGGGTTLNVTGAISVTGNSTMVLQSINTTAKIGLNWAGVGVTLNAASVQVDAGSSINADSQGYVGNAGPGAGIGGGGGNYGGLGGYNNTDLSALYGSSSMPVDLGSGGGAAQYAGSNGGGALRLNVSGTLTINGIISANGEMVEPARGGAGSGGSVYVTTATLAGSGKFTANGGSNTNAALSGSAAGGGGRVAIHFMSLSNFTGFTASTSAGGTFTGTQPGNAGSDGTVAFFDDSVPYGNVNVYHGYTIPANTTTLFNNFTVASGGSLTIGGNSQINVTHAVHIAGAVTALSTNTTGLLGKKWLGQGVTIQAASMQIDATGSISADAQGYVANAGPGGGGYTTGGSYGGAGGGQAATSVYGSAVSPTDIGSGGGSGQNTGGGAGGGAIQLLVTGPFTNNGVISANGGSIANSGYGGAGSGGSVFVQAKTVQGSGTISANGGSNTLPNNAGSGGGGGRIAINYVAGSPFNQAAVTVNAGTGATPGSPGTISSVQSGFLRFLQPSKPVVHDLVTVQWFSDLDGSAAVAVTVAGPQSSTLAVSGSASSVVWDTTAIPDGIYEIRLKTTDSTGTVYQTSKTVVVNNSVKWFSGTLTTNTHWTSNNVYALDADFVIPSGVTLTVDPGTVVKVLAGVQIIVQSGGILSANGTSGSPVIFTTFDDSSVGGNTNFNQGITLPVAGEWQGILVAGGGTFTANANTIVRYAVQGVAATIGVDTTFNSTQVYEITSALTVATGATLTIQPGAVIKFDAGGGINFQPGSTLIANGTLAQPIYFTSINDNSVGGNTNNNDGKTPPQPGDWNTVGLNGVNASFKYVQMQYGGGPANATALAGMLQIGGNSAVNIANSTFANSYYVGVQTGYPNGGDTVTITDTVFYGIEDRAINAFGGSIVHVVNDTFDGNAYGILNHGGATIDVANSVFSNSTGLQYPTLYAITAVVNTDVYTTAPGVTNYGSMPDPTGTLGNISSKPVYMNAALHDYHPTYGSPLIDAGNGTVANYPLTDAFGNQRNNFAQVLKKTGTQDSNGKYPDIGAYEFVQAAPSNLDLTVSAVQGPASVTVGQQAQLTWTVTNIGSGTVYGPWHDAVYLASSPGTNLTETFAGQVLVGNGVVLGPGASYQASGTFTVPGSTSGAHQWEVKTNVRGEVFEGANTANNKSFSLASVYVTLPELVAGASPVSGSFAAIGQSAYYQINPAATQATRIQLSLATGLTGGVQLFIGGGYLPSPQHYDYQSSEFNSTTASVVIPAGTAQTYYIAAYAQSIQVQPSGFLIQASPVQFAFTSLTPTNAVAYQNQTFTFVGGGFGPNTLFTLLNPTGLVYKPTSVFLVDTEHAQVTFSLTSAAPGIWSASASNGTPITLISVLNVDRAPFGGSVDPTQLNDFHAVLRTPVGFRAGFPAIVTLDYTNASSSDIPAPLVYIQSNATLTEIPPDCTGCDFSFKQKHANSFNSGLVLAINQHGPAGVLPAGASGSISFMATPPTSGNALFSVTTAGYDIIKSQFESLFNDGCIGGPGCNLGPTQTGAYAVAVPGGGYLPGQGYDFCSVLMPAGSSPLGFNRTCMALLNNAGFTYMPQASTPVEGGKTVRSLLTYANFNKILADDATALSKSGIYEYDLQNLLNFEFQKDGLASFNLRYHQGAFGFGRSHPFDIKLTAATAGPTISYPDGGTRVFNTVNPGQTNVFLGPVGDSGSVALQTDGTWLLTDVDQTLSHFIPATTGFVLDYLQDHNGNRTNMTYTGGQVTAVTDAFGNSISFQYDSLGHITKFTDAAGRDTTYSYTTLSDNQNSTFLNSVTNALGTTTITWNQGGAGVAAIADSCIPTYCEPAIGIANILYPDGTNTSFKYDAVGRLVSSQRDGGAKAVTYTYNGDGSITLTDALGNTTTTSGNQFGLPTTITDPLGSMRSFKYDPENKLISALGPLGDSSSFDYDQLGNPASVQSANGNITNFDFMNYLSLDSVSDPSGNDTSFSYDPAYDLTGMAYPNGQKESSTYDSAGRLLTRTNRRGNTVTYAYGAHGLLASKTYPNGSQVLFSYDSHFNLQSVTAANGTTRYTFDGADRMTGIGYPDGTSLSYTYNSKGQRSSMRDSTGFTTNYTYDAAGRISTLTNGAAAPIVAYTYDANGRLTTKQFGNGSSTSLTYDASGNPVSVSQSSSQGLIGKYTYTYDAEGQAASVSSPAGNLTYAYDLDGQLTSVGSPAGNIQYTYDDSGNRSNVTTNGVSSDYLVNNLNEYTSANGVNYLYDADGNLTSGNGLTYTYNDENKLLTMVSANDTWSFQYDGLGNRVAATHNGQVVHYLIDPTGNGNIIAEFDGSGNVTAHYTYGLDLTSTVQASGTTGYYHFDAIGNTTQITNATGAVVNSYTYRPFGEKTVISATIPNPFTYNGQVGVRDEGAGIYFMRNRWYNPSLGRFQQEDPSGFSGGVNFYEFANNSPSNLIDPSGFFGDPSVVVQHAPPAPPAVPNEPANAPLTNIGDSTFGHVLNAIGGELPGGAAFVGGTTSNILTVNSLANSIGSHDTLGMIHDGTLAITRQIGLFLPEKLAPGPLGILQGVIKHIGAIDEGSQIIFNHFLIPADPRPDGVPLRGRPFLCGACIYKNPRPNTVVPVNGSQDPNAKITSGFGDKGFIPAGQPVTYTIFFENLAIATAPAQRIMVTDALPANLDWSSVELDEIGFNDATIYVPGSTQTYTGRATVSTDPNPVSVTASLNPTTGLLTWTMQSVDPVTGGAPANPLAGFLPPDNAAHAGTGYVTFTVNPKANLANATVINNQASIVFDANAAILTNTVTNTLDTTTPTSAISPLPATTTSTSVPVAWSGSDPTGAGVSTYNIYVATDAGPYSLWLSATTLTSSNYIAAPGHSYSFFSLVTNNVGLAQSTPGTIQTISVLYVAPTVTVSPASSTIAATQSLPVVVTVATTGTITGSVVLTSGTYTSSAVTLTSGSASFVIPAGALANGIDTLTATYTPDTASAYLFSAATGNATVTVGTTNVVGVTVGASGAAFSVDGTVYTTTQTFSWTPGSTHTLATTSPQTANGIQQTFTSWSDGGAITHTVTATSATTTYTATFATAYLLTASATLAAGGTVTPASGTYYPAGTTVTLTATPATGYTFASWTGPVTSASTPATNVVMSAPQTVTANFTLIPVPTITLAPNALTFTTVAGATSAAQTVQLKNTGTPLLNITGISIAGTNPQPFTQTNTCGTSLAAGATCTISVTFSSATTGTFSATLSVADNAAASPQTVALTATATAPPTFSIAATPATQSVKGGSAASYSITASPVGGIYSTPVTFAVTGLPTGATASFQPATVTPGSAGATSVLTIQTVAITGAIRTLPASTTGPTLALLGMIFFASRRRRARILTSLLAIGVIACATSLTGCGGMTPTSLTPTTYTITVTATAAAATQTTTVTLTVTP